MTTETQRELNHLKAVFENSELHGHCEDIETALEYYEGDNIALDHAEGCIKHGNQNYESAAVVQRSNNHIIKTFNARD